MQTVEVRSRVDGTLEKIALEEGRIISQGDLMFIIDRLPFEAALAQARASLMQAQVAHVRSRQGLARVRPLAQEDAVSQQELESAIAREAGDEASVEAAAMWPSLRKPRKRSSPKRRNDRSWASFRIALGPRAGQKVLSLQTVPSHEARPMQQCCVSAQGFSLHAEVWLGGLACLTNSLAQWYFSR